jgi:hypothetical protein
VMLGVSLEGSGAGIGVTVIVWTETFVGAPPSVILEPSSSTKTVTGTMTTVVNELPGSWRL